MDSRKIVLKETAKMAIGVLVCTGLMLGVFALLGKLNTVKPRLPLPFRGLAGAGVVTMVELLAGLIFNRNYRVWDYRELPMNYHGQICLRFFLLWIPISLLAMGLYTWFDRRMPEKFPAGRWRSAA